MYTWTGLWPNIIDNSLPNFALKKNKKKENKKITFCLILREHDQHIQKASKPLLYEVDNHRLISFLSRKREIRKKNTTNPSKDPSFLIKLHCIPSPLEVTTVLFLRSQIL